MTLTKLDNRAIPDAPQEIRLVINARNEVTRLPYILTYYRKLGVSRFFCLDDHSTDGTTAYLLEQADCHVFLPSTSYSASGSGVQWQNEVLDQYCTGYWTVTVDADELLIYPHCEKINLPEFCAYLDQEGSTMMFSFMLDCYPEGPLTSAVCVPGKPFTEICTHFDKDYTFSLRRQFLVKPRLSFPPEEVIGGPRLRLFYPEQRDHSLFNQLFQRVKWKSLKVLEKLGVRFADRPHMAPALFKVPLAKWQPGNARLTGHHVVPPVNGKLSPVTGVLLHFKFFADFHNKALEEVKRGEHWGGGQEYRRYLHYVSKNPDVTFMYSGSVRYKNSDTVLAGGLMRSSPALDKKAGIDLNQNQSQ